ncbi:M48 metallopeptidase family protein [Parasphingorhabdus pacifica]
MGKGARLNLHWATMQLPPSLIHYVIAHELAHLEDPNHPPAFWVAVARAVPDYEARKLRLARVGAHLWSE